MKARRRKRPLLVAMLGFAALFGLAVAGVFYAMGGYWENASVLKALSGPKRFKQYVADPVPEGIYNLEGGYSGFRQGFVKTTFRFTGDFSKYPFLEKWEPLKPGERVEMVDDAEAKGYKRKDAKVFLIIDQPGHAGYLLVP